MTDEIRQIKTDLAIIGSGIAGFAASIFALNKNISTSQVGNTGAVAYTTGYLDLLGTIEGTTEKIVDPWQELENLKSSNPAHPLNKVPEKDIKESFNQFTAFLNECGISYNGAAEKNISALTPAGTLKQTLYVPKTMLAGPEAMSSQAPCVIIDFKGLKGFSAKQIVANLKGEWPNISSAKLTFPDMEHGELYPEVMARALEVSENREKLAALIKDAAGKVKVVGLPAILGMHDPDLVKSELEKLTGMQIFEIPTMPPSVPGIRLREMFEQVFPKKGLTLIPQQKVQSLDFNDQGVTLSLSDNYGPITINAKAVILATGRFLSGGLDAQLEGIKETLLDLPVTQPEQRVEWYNTTYTAPEGHPINRAGIEVDDQFRPLGKDGKPYHPGLFAAGIILANQDWIRSRSGAGIAISTAFKAVEAAEKFIHA